MASSETVNGAELIERILNEHAAIPFPNLQIKSQTVFDRAQHRYLLINVGEHLQKRIHHIVVDVELRGDKFWIQYDGTEDGIALDLEQAGIPKDRIVLGWLTERERQMGEYAVA
jgi:hypothetical protein